VTAGANSRFDAALDIQRFLTSGPFTYTTHPPQAPGDIDSLTFFLTESHAGFCQQYATAMAVMARLAGIPSRVAVGFTAGTRQPDGHWLVTTHDAHAWPELYFPEFGWLPFEPTPRGDGQTVTPAYARATPNQSGGPDSGGKTSGVDPVHKPNATTGNHGKSAATGTKTDATTHHSSADGFGATLWIIAAALLVLALVAPSAARQLTRRRRMLQLHGAHPVTAAAWAELRDSTIDAGAPWDDDRSPRQSAYAVGQWLAASGDVRSALGRLTRAEEEHRYSSTPSAGPTSMATDVRTVRMALRGRQSRRRGIRARLLPPSTVGRAAARWSAAIDNLDEIRPARLGARSRSRFRKA